MNKFISKIKISNYNGVSDVYIEGNIEILLLTDIIDIIQYNYIFGNQLFITE